jgi:hypothetical protein
VLFGEGHALPGCPALLLTCGRTRCAGGDEAQLQEVDTEQQQMDSECTARWPAHLTSPACRCTSCWVRALPVASRFRPLAVPHPAEDAEQAAPCICTPRELAAMAARFLNMLLDLFGAAEAAGGFSSTAAAPRRAACAGQPCFPLHMYSFQAALPCAPPVPSSTPSPSPTTTHTPACNVPQDAPPEHAPAAG